MKIQTLETYPVRIPLKPECRMVSALGRHDESQFVVVRLLSDNGIEGAGEATATVRWSGETVWGVQALIDRVFTPAILGMELDSQCAEECIAAIDARMDQLAIHNWFAKSAIEMACWDALGKAAGKPVYDLLGGACRPLAIPGRFSIGAYEPSRAAARAAELAALGFDTLKVKVGGSAEEDIARVRAVRTAIGPDRKLVIDANCGWDVTTAIHCVKQLRDCDLLLVEQPTPDGDYAAIARVRRETGARVMADDMCFNLVHAQELVRNQACDVISVYPGKNGGIRKSRQIARFCESHGVATSIGSNLEFDIATAAMGHLIVATPNLQVEQYPGDIYGPAYYEFRILKEPLAIQGPMTTITSRPGLGVEVDWSLVRSNRCRD
ncbi:MAG TPA: mandelate racemase/muconate lactonizing enzyme family protein [Pirellulaceae bacterium]|nr:mandelate racemase/muconate lactonizing enzyme family protein [Pirellulaceae bacterium]